MTSPHGTCTKQDWATPRWFIRDLQRALQVEFTLDVCATDRDVAVCDTYFSPFQNGLKQEWSVQRGAVWCNPPFAEVEPWIKKAREAAEKHTVCTLLPASVETLWCQSHAAYAHVYLITPRLNYWDPSTKRLVLGIAKPSMLWYFDKLTLATAAKRQGVLCLEYLYLPRPPEAKR